MKYLHVDWWSGGREAIKEWLGQAKGLELSIEARLGETDRLRELAARLKRIDPRGFEQAIGQLRQLEAELEAEVAALTRAKRSICRMIARLDSPEERNLLELRYLCGKKWEEVADRMGYSWQGIHKVHGRVLDHLQEWMEVDAGAAV